MFLMAVPLKVSSMRVKKLLYLLGGRSNNSQALRAPSSALLHACCMSKASREHLAPGKQRQAPPLMPSDVNKKSRNTGMP